MPSSEGEYTEREFLEGLRYEDKFPDEDAQRCASCQAPITFAQMVSMGVCTPCWNTACAQVAATNQNREQGRDG